MQVSQLKTSPVPCVIVEKLDSTVKFSSRKGFRMLKYFLLIIILLPLYAAERDGITYPDEITVSGTPLVLNGLGTREATMFNVNVYVAALYVETPSSSGSSIYESDEARRLILHFVRDVGMDDITGAWQQGFENNAANQVASMQDDINLLNSWMREMKDGDRMQFTCIPGTGLEVSVKGSVKGTIPGNDFAGAFFSIWLGDNPPNSGLKNGLLGLD